MDQRTSTIDLRSLLTSLTGLEIDPAREASIAEQLLAVRAMTAEIERLDLDWLAPPEPFNPGWPGTGS